MPNDEITLTIPPATKAGETFTAEIDNAGPQTTGQVTMTTNGAGVTFSLNGDLPAAIHTRTRGSNSQ